MLCGSTQSSIDKPEIIDVRIDEQAHDVSLRSRQTLGRDVDDEIPRLIFNFSG